MLGTLIVSPLASRIRDEATRHRITGAGHGGDEVAG